MYSYSIVDAHAHIFPEKIARKATENIGRFYDIPMCHLGSAEELLRRGSAIGVKRYLVRSTATRPRSASTLGLASTTRGSMSKCISTRSPLRQRRSTVK